MTKRLRQAIPSGGSAIQNRLDRLSITDQLKWQSMLLSAQFLLGMGINLVGLPSQTVGLAHAVTVITLGLHMMVAAGLLTNGLVIVKLAKPCGRRARRLAIFSVAGIVAAIVCGVLTLAASLSGLWSYLMAVAFLAIFGFYGRLISLCKRPGST